MSVVGPRRNRRRLLRVSAEAVRGDDSPLSAVLVFGSRGHGRWSRPAGAAAIALGFHAALALAAGLTHATREHEEAPAPKEVVATLEQKPAPKPLPPPAAPPHPPAARAPRLARPAPAKTTPPTPAQAGKVVAAAPDPNAPIDMTGFNLVVGEGKSYAGGYTASTGTSKKAVETPNVSATGKPDAPHVPNQDYSRPASPAHRDWSCPWPDEEQTSDLKDARVIIRVRLDSDGLPVNVEILNSPLGGFAAAARHCAEMETFRAAHDSAGNPIASTTAPFVVHFLR